MTRKVPPKKPIVDAVETVQGITNKRGIGNLFANLATLGKQPEIEVPTVQPPSPQAAKEVVQQVAAEHPASPRTRVGTDPLPGDRNNIPQVSEGPPPGYQLDPDEFDTPAQAAAQVVKQVQAQQNPIANAVEQAVPGARSNLAGSSPQAKAGDERYEKILADSKVGDLSPDDEDYFMANIREGDYDNYYQNGPEAVQPSIPAAVQLIQDVQAENPPTGGRVIQSSRSPNDWILDEISPGPTRSRPRLRSPDEWRLNEISPGPTNQPSRDWTLDEDLPPTQAAAQVIQGVQSESQSTAPGESYNAGVGGGDGGSVPPGNRTTFNIPEPDESGRPSGPRAAGGPVEKGLWNHAVAGFLAQAGDKGYSDSVIGDAFRNRKFPQVEDSGFADKAAFLGGRVFGDVQGYGTRKGFWNLTPEDAVGTAFREVGTNQGLSAPQSQLARYAAATTLGLAGGNYNPLNLAEGGRTEGFGAVNPTDEDPRKPINAVGEFLFDRAMLGRTGRLLPWQEFHEERPDVSYDKYAAYQDYIRAPSFLGIVKGTMDGIDGPEARVVGSRVQPEAVAAALAAGAAVIGGFGHYNNKNKRMV